MFLEVLIKCTLLFWGWYPGSYDCSSYSLQSWVPAWRRSILWKPKCILQSRFVIWYKYLLWELYRESLSGYYFMTVFLVVITPLNITLQKSFLNRELMTDSLVTALHNQWPSKLAVEKGGISQFAFLVVKQVRDLQTPFCCLQALFSESGATFTEAGASGHFNLSLYLSAVYVIWVIHVIWVMILWLCLCFSLLLQYIDLLKKEEKDLGLDLNTLKFSIKLLCYLGRAFWLSVPQFPQL